MGKQRTSRPQAFKATAAATSEMKAHVDERNQGSADFRKGNTSENQFADERLTELVQSYLDSGVGLKTSQLLPVDGYPSLKLPPGAD